MRIKNLYKKKNINVYNYNYFNKINNFKKTFDFILLFLLKPI